MLSHTLQIVKPRKLTKTLLAVVLALGVLSTAGQIAKFQFGHGNLHGLVPLFYLDNEASVPTWYSSMGLMLASTLLVAIGALRYRERDPFRYHWLALGVLFLLLSMDEVAMIHEYPIDLLRERLHATGLLYYAWVIPGAAFVVLVFLGLLNFLRHLDRGVRFGFVAAGAVFVGGAIGIEMLSGLHASRFGEDNLGYALIITCEELCEMLGVVLFIHVLMGVLSASVSGIQVQMTPAQVAADGGRELSPSPAWFVSGLETSP